MKLRTGTICLQVPKPEECAVRDRCFLCTAPRSADPESSRDAFLVGLLTGLELLREGGIGFRPTLCVKHETRFRETLSGLQDAALYDKLGIRSGRSGPESQSLWCVRRAQSARAERTKVPHDGSRRATTSSPSPATRYGVECAACGECQPCCLQAEHESHGEMVDFLAERLAAPLVTALLLCEVSRADCESGCGATAPACGDCGNPLGVRPDGGTWGRLRDDPTPTGHLPGCRLDAALAAAGLPTRGERDRARQSIVGPPA